MLSPFQKGTISCLFPSALQPRSPSYLPSDWLLYSLGDWFTRSHLSMTHSLSTTPPSRAELAYKQHRTHPQHWLSLLVTRKHLLTVFVTVCVSMVQSFLLGSVFPLYRSTCVWFFKTHVLRSQESWRPRILSWRA